MIVMCTCGRVKVKPPAEVAIMAGGSDTWWFMAVDPDPSQPNAIMHNLCPECAKKAGRDAIVARLGRFSRGNHEAEGGA